MDESKKTEMEANWKKVVTQAITDDGFKKSLMSDPLGIMKQHGLHLPEGVETLVGADKLVRLKKLENCSAEIEEEIKWWKWRLDMIYEFGQEEKERGVKYVAPVIEEGEDI